MIQICFKKAKKGLKCKIISFPKLGLSKFVLTVKCNDISIWIPSQSKKSALLILNVKEANTNYGCGIWFPCNVDTNMISKIHALRDKSRDGVFGTFDYVILAQDFQCLDESNQTNSNMTDNVVPSTLTFEYAENDQLCEGNCMQVIYKYTYLVNIWLQKFFKIEIYFYW